MIGEGGGGVAAGSPRRRCRRFRGALAGDGRGVGGDGDVGRELGLDGVEEFGGFVGGFGGEAGDGGGVVGDFNRHAFAHGESADVVGVDGLEAVVGDISDTICEGLDVREDVGGEFVASVRGAVEVFGLGVLDVSELVVQQVVSERGWGLDFLVWFCDSISRRGLRLGVVGPSIDLFGAGRP